MTAEVEPGDNGVITPNLYRGSDSDRIQSAIDDARETTNLVVIPRHNANGSDRWLLDRAILLPSNITIVLDNSTVQLSDATIDNIFRSDNLGRGTGAVEWNHNIKILGLGDAVIRGADNPRSTGGGKQLSLEARFDGPDGRGTVSYGTDASRPSEKQMGDWRNHGILMAYVDGFALMDVTIENTHCWAVTHERVRNAVLARIRINNPPRITVDGVTHYVANRDGINLRQGCKGFRIDDVYGETGDDFIALTLLGVTKPRQDAEMLSGVMATSPHYDAPEDDIEDIWITNVKCKTKNHGIALRTIDHATIHNVFIDGLMVEGNPDVPSHQTALLFGGRGYGDPSPIGGIRDVHAMNLMSSCRSGLVHIEARIEDCTFVNGVYTGEAEYVVTYHDFDDDTPKYTVSEGNRGRSEVSNVHEVNLIAVPRSSPSG